jgi:hypothetical protein
MLRRTFGPKREEVAEDWRKLNIEELRNLYSSPNNNNNNNNNQTKEVEMDEAPSSQGRHEKCFEHDFRNCWIPLWRPKRRW